MIFHNMVNNKLYENEVTVKLAPRTSCLFDMLHVHKSHHQHQRTMSVGNEESFIAKMQIISSHIIFLIKFMAYINSQNI